MAPACISRPGFDRLRDYAERGRAFARLAGFDADGIGEITELGIL